MTTSIVIPNWNGRDFLGPCLRALEAQTRQDFETIVVDNASDDDSLELLASEFPDVRVVPLDKNRGFAGAMNEGIRRAEGRYVAFLNNDTEVEPDWLEELTACLERHPRAAAATSKMLLADNPRFIDDAGDVLTPTIAPIPRGHGEPDEGQYEDEQEVFSASGGASLWRTSALAEIGLFSEAFFAYYEDVDLGFRARLAGYECWYAPRAIVRHKRGGTSGALSDVSLRLHVRNRWLLIVRTMPGSLLIRTLPLIAAADKGWWGRTGDTRPLVALLPAYGAALRALPRTLRERRKIQRRRRVGADDVARFLRGEFERPPSTTRAAD